MSQARRDYLATVASLESAIDSPSAIDGLPHEVDHNNAARLIRRGLMVVSYSALEDFLKGRTDEVLATVASGHVPFSDLPEPLRQMTTESALESLTRTFRRIRAAGDDVMQVVHQVAGEVASTASAAYALSGYGFGRGEANLSSEFIKKMMMGFNLNNPWGQVNLLSQRANLGAGNLEAELKTYLQKRNEAAHTSIANVESSHLQSFRAVSVAIAFGFDNAISRAARLLSRGDPRILSARFDAEADLELVYIEPRRSGFAAKRERDKRAMGVRPTSRDAWTLAKAAAPSLPILQSANALAGLDLNWEC